MTVGSVRARAPISPIDVYDVAGKRIRRLMQGALAEGEHDIVWDGRDADGTSVATGFYFIRVRSTAGLRTTKVVRIE